MKSSDFESKDLEVLKEASFHEIEEVRYEDGIFVIDRDGECGVARFRQDYRWQRNRWKEVRL
jgi:hypothetical protein